MAEDDEEAVTRPVLGPQEGPMGHVKVGSSTKVLRAHEFLKSLPLPESFGTLERDSIEESLCRFLYSWVPHLQIEERPRPRKQDLPVIRSYGVRSSFLFQRR